MDESYHSKANLAPARRRLENSGMKPLVAAGLLAVFASLSPAQTYGTLPSNAKIYLDAPADFGSLLTAAIARRHVPVTITNEKDGADYQLQALSGANVIANPEWANKWLRGYGEAAIRVIDIHTGDTVFFSAVERNSALHDWKSAAEVCAARLRTAVARSDSRIHYAHPILDF